MKKIATYQDLDGASVFVTGGGSGIGAAITEAFLRQGANVTFVQRRDGLAFCDEMEAQTRRRPDFIRCDVTDVGSLQGAINTASARQGAVTVLINNAANDERHMTEGVTEEFWDRNQAVNLKPYFFASQAVFPGMRAAGGGSIINLTSISYIMGNAGYPSYVTANAGINGMTRAHAREFGPDRVRVNALAPGWVMTDKQKELWVTPEGLASHIARQCLKDHLLADDIVGGVLFLASCTSRMMTGQTLVIDGGVVTSG